MEAKIVLIQTDMGNGGAYCSNCNYDLDDGDPFVKIPPICPKCQAIFIDKESYTNMGGSDF